tara:strand:- start:24420 stop:24938 length:519 start_codon:yes stop_codon:yes gene_type:complete
VLKQLIVYAGAAIFSLAGYAQCLYPPDEFVLETPEDYEDYEVLAYELMACLVNDPLAIDIEKTEEAKAFCLVWLGGTSSCTLQVNTNLATFLDEKPEYLYHYIFSLAMIYRDFPRLSLEEKESEALYLIALYDEKISPKKRNRALKKIKNLHTKGKLIPEINRIKKENVNFP